MPCMKFAPHSKELKSRVKNKSSNKSKTKYFFILSHRFNFKSSNNSRKKLVSREAGTHVILLVFEYPKTRNKQCDSMTRNRQGHLVRSFPCYMEVKFQQKL